LGKGINNNEYGIKSNDVLHITCAILSKCEYFITCDKGLLNKDISEITIMNPIDFRIVE
jgi:predicted nucleic acid-binding protein